MASGDGGPPPLATTNEAAEEPEEDTTASSDPAAAATDAVAEQEFDPLLLQKSVKINFLKFLMFFNGTAQIDLLIMKAAFPSKQRKLSHLIAIYGHQYLLKDVLK